VSGGRTAVSGGHPDALHLDDVSVHVGGRALLSKVQLRVAAGELVALLGRNGAGKSTLLKAALGLIAPSGGAVRIGARRVGELDGRERAARLAWLPQHFAVHEAFTAGELVATARFRFDEPAAAGAAAARRALARTGAAELEARVVSTLSGGELQRVALAVLLAQEAPLLLMDEPANHLDPAQQLAMYRLIGELWRDGHGVLCVTHDPNLLHHVLSGGEAERVRVVGMEQGAIAFERTLADAALPEALSTLFGVRIARVVHEGVPFFASLPVPVGTKSGSGSGSGSESASASASPSESA
jgi:iron complex transport system ATP-binding protein